MQKNNTENSYLKRFLLALLPTATLVFMIFLIVPLDTVINNQKYLVITPGNVTVPLLLVSVVLVLAVSAVIALFQKGIFRFFVCLETGIILAVFIQLLFFNGSLKVLDGSEPDWGSMKVQILLNCAAWAVIAFLPFVLSFVFHNQYQMINRIICVAVLSAQIVALLTVAMTTEDSPKYGEEYVLNGKNQYVLSEKENIVVFSLDYFSKDLFDEILKEYPEVKDEYKDFTYYSNTSGNYDFTYPSLCCLYTGMEYTGELSTMDYFEKSWNSEKAKKFYDTLHNSNYTVNIFSDINYIAGYGYNMLGKVDNLTEAKSRINVPTVLRLLHVAAYRIAPTALKPYLILSTDDVNEKMGYVCKDGTGYEPLALEGNFYQKFKSTGISLDSERNVYSWHHLLGAHVPHTTDEYCEPSDNTSGIIQCRGYLYAISEYMKQMRALGIYENSIIIITADHGEVPSYFVPFLVKGRNVSGESLEENSAPVSQMDIMPTIAELAFGNGTEYGQPVTEIEEGIERERVFRRFEILEDVEDVGWIGSIGQLNMAKDWGSHYNALLEYRFTGNQDTLKKKFSSKDYTVKPIVDSFY